MTTQITSTGYPGTGEEAFTDADHTKLDGVESEANKIDSTNSFTNLLENGDFGSWSAGISAAPDGWVIGGTGAAIARSSDSVVGSFSCEVTSGAGDAYPGQAVAAYSRYQGRAVSFGCWVNASAASVARIYIYDGAGYSYSPFHTGGGGWEWLTVTHTLAAGATELAAKLRIELSTNVVYFDGAVMVEGSVCPAFSPKPIIDDGVMLQNFTPTTNTSDGKVGQWAYDTNYIYVCIATDTWKRIGLDLQGW